MLGRVYQAVKMMTLSPGKQKTKKNQKKKKGKNIIDSVNVLGWTDFLGSTQTVTSVGSYALQCPCHPNVICIIMKTLC